MKRKRENKESIYFNNEKEEKTKKVENNEKDY